jgi:excinuclease ABC subunit B
MYADNMTDSMKKAISETKRRRAIQEAYNEEHGITPKTIQKKIPDLIRATQAAEEEETYYTKLTKGKKMTKSDIEKLVASLEVEMKEAAKALDFERAAELRDTLFELKVEG